MRVLSDSVAIGYPRSPDDLERCAAACEACRNGSSKIDIRIGIGGLRSQIPFRVLGYASCVHEALERDVKLLVGKASCRLSIFSSGLKSGYIDYDGYFLSTVALASALRTLGVTQEISIDLAPLEKEIPELNGWAMPQSLTDWIQDRSRKHDPESDPNFVYAIEHSAPSMFADLRYDDEASFLRITLGGATEARFWGVRQSVRDCLIESGLPVEPAVAIIMRSIKVPWYQPIDAEPTIIEAKADLEGAIRSLDKATNPKYGGNPGLKRELKTIKRKITNDHVSDVYRAISSISKALEYCEVNDIKIGRNASGILGMKQ